MEERDYDELMRVCGTHRVGGLCAAMTVDWLGKALGGRGLPSSFAEEDLERLGREQAAYYQLAMKGSGDEGFLAYAEQKGLTARRLTGGKIYSSGEIDDLADVRLDRGRGYALCFSETNIGSQGAHVIAILCTAGGTIQIRDQNVGQKTATDMGKVAANYTSMMEHCWEEYLEQEKRVKKGLLQHVTVPAYRRWELFLVS